MTTIQKITVLSAVAVSFVLHACSQQTATPPDLSTTFSGVSKQEVLKKVKQTSPPETKQPKTKTPTSQPLQTLPCEVAVKPYEVFACGLGDDWQEARKDAIVQIAAAVNGVQVQSISQRQENCNAKESEVMQCEIEIIQQDGTKSKAQLFGDFRQVAAQKLPDGYHQIVLVYDKSPFFKRLSRRFSQDPKCLNGNKPKGVFLQKNPELQDLNFPMELTFDRDNQYYMLSCGETDLRLPSVSDLFDANQSESFETNSSFFRDGDKMTVRIRTQQPMYFTLLSVDYQGNVGFIFQNRYEEQDFVYPEKEEDDLIVSLGEATSNINLKEMLILLQTPTELQLKLQEISETLIKGNDQLLNVLELLDQYDHQITTYRIQP